MIDRQHGKIVIECDYCLPAAIVQPTMSCESVPGSVVLRCH